MTGENVSATNDNHDPDPRRKISRLESNALIQGLERLRECFEQRLGRLEAVAREQTADPVAGRSELDQQLQERIHDYEEEQLRLRSQAERREREWRTALEQLEDDRTLLAEAWERLERERLEVVVAAPQGTNRPPIADRVGAQPARPRPDLADSTNDHVAVAILQQFQALRNDVRRNARQRGTI